jgi:Peptidase S24-like
MSVHAKDLLTLENTTDAPRLYWNAERSGLVADALRLGGRLRLRVHGESMLPTLWPGDVVGIASCTPEDVRRGEIVLALRDGRLFLHRLLSPCTPSGFLLRGDSMPGPDPWFSPENLLGRLVSRPGGRKSSAVLSRAAGRVFCHFDLARRLALKMHSSRRTSTTSFQDSESTAELATL